MFVRNAAAPAVRATTKTTAAAIFPYHCFIAIRHSPPPSPARRTGGPPHDWGSGCGGDFGEHVVRGEEALPEAGAERAVVDGAADLEQPIGTAPRPAHLLRFGHATIDEKVGRSLGQRRADPQPGPVSFAVVDQPIALPDEVAVQRPQ